MHDCRGTKGSPALHSSVLISSRSPAHTICLDTYYTRSTLATTPPCDVSEPIVPHLCPTHVHTCAAAPVHNHLLGYPPHVHSYLHHIVCSASIYTGRTAAHRRTCTAPTRSHYLCQWSPIPPPGLMSLSNCHAPPSNTCLCLGCLPAGHRTALEVLAASSCPHASPQPGGRPLQPPTQPQEPCICSRANPAASYHLRAPPPDSPVAA